VLVAIVGLQILVSVNLTQQEIKRIEANRDTITNPRLLQTRDERNLDARLQIWGSALAITRDYPLTGIGLSMIRSNRVRVDYPIPIMEGLILPHAHNELLQIATDMGLPGLAVFLAIYGSAGWMLLKSWRRGDAPARVVSVATAGGLLAHFIYGLGDAITLWDRFAFIFWILLGLAGAQYRLVMEQGHLARAGASEAVKH
jgi:O-antigen ligase